MSRAGQISLTSSQSLNHIYLPTPTETQSMSKNAQDRYLGCNSTRVKKAIYIYTQVCPLSAKTTHLTEFYRM